MSRAFDVVDAQVHLTLKLDETRLLAAMDALGIAGVVLDEFWGIADQSQGMPCEPLPGGSFRPLSPYAQAATLRYPDRFSYLQRIEPRDPQLAAVMDLLSSSRGCRAVRLLLRGRPERAAFGDGGFDNVLGLAQAHQLPICVLGADMASLPTVAARFPELPIVLDHCGWPRKPEHWEAVLRAGALPTAHLKWSHAARAFSGSDDPSQAAQREFLRALDAFGVERVMWAGDVTEEESGASWADLLGFVRDNPKLSDGDKEWVLARTARSVFRWPAPAHSA